MRVSLTPYLYVWTDTLSLKNDNSLEPNPSLSALVLRYGFYPFCCASSHGLRLVPLPSRCIVPPLLRFKATPSSSIPAFNLSKSKPYAGGSAASVLHPRQPVRPRQGQLLKANYRGCVQKPDRAQNGTKSSARSHLSGAEVRRRFGVGSRRRGYHLHHVRQVVFCDMPSQLTLPCSGSFYDHFQPGKPLHPDVYERLTVEVYDQGRRMLYFHRTTDKTFWNKIHIPRDTKGPHWPIGPIYFKSTKKEYLKCVLIAMGCMTI